MDPQFDFRDGDNPRDQRAVSQKTKARMNRAVHEELVEMGFPDEIASRSNELYQTISGGKTHREMPRMCLKFYAAYAAFHEHGNIRDPILLGAKFGLTEGQVKKAFTRFSTHQAYLLAVVIAEPCDLVREYAELTGVMNEFIIQNAFQYVRSITLKFPELGAGGYFCPCKVAILLICRFCRENGIALDEALFFSRTKKTVSSLSITRKVIDRLLQ